MKYCLNAFQDIDASYPVMVWIHGGSYQMGGNIPYPGHFLASRNVVVVVVNYRLGNIGMLTFLHIIVF